MADFPTGEIEYLLLTEDSDDFTTTERDVLEFDFDGIIGDQRHGGRTRLADVRIPTYEKKVDEVLNRQSVSLIDGLSLDHIGDELDIDPDVVARNFGVSRRLYLASCLGANMVISEYHGSDDMPGFNRIPNATDFGPFDSLTGKFSAASVMITRFNGPCVHPGRRIRDTYPDAGDALPKKFVQVAQGRRGYVGMVVKTGEMSVGQSVMFRSLDSAT